MEKPQIDGRIKDKFNAVRSRVNETIQAVANEAPGVAKQGFEIGSDIAKSKTGLRILTGAGAGAAIAAALPFVAISSGALLGAGALVLWKSLTDKE